MFSGNNALFISPLIKAGKNESKSMEKIRT